MSNNSIIPDDPERRRLIIVHSSQQWKALEKIAEAGGQATNHEREEVNKFLRGGPHIYFLCVEDALIDTGPIMASIRRQGLLNPDAVLMQDPFDSNRYERAEDFLFSGVIRKYLRMKEYFLLVGASSVSITHMTATNREGRVLFTGKLSTRLPRKKDSEVAGVSVDYSSVSIERIKNQLMLSAKGMEISNITDDPHRYLDIYPYLKDFGFYARNRPTKGTFEFELRATEEIQSNLELACSLTIPVKLLKTSLGIKFNRLRQESHSYELKVQVLFGKAKERTSKE